MLRVQPVLKEQPVFGVPLVLMGLQDPQDLPARLDLLVLRGLRAFKVLLELRGPRVRKELLDQRAPKVNKVPRVPWVREEPPDYLVREGILVLLDQQDLLAL